MEMLKWGYLCIIIQTVYIMEWLEECFLYGYAMLYAKMFHGRDILKHGKSGSRSHKERGIRIASL